MFEPVIANVSENVIKKYEKLENYCPGEHFALVYFEPFETVNTYHAQGKQLTMDTLANVRHVPDFVVFDKYIENYDRHGDNVCLLPNESLGNKVDYYLFDHDLAFQRDRIGTGSIKSIRDLNRKLVKMVFVIDHIDHTRFFDRMIGRIEMLKNKIPDIINEIPPSWRINHAEYISEVETLLTKFTDKMFHSYLAFNKERFPFLK